VPATLQLKRFVSIWLMVFWSAAAAAAQATFAHDLRDIPPAAVAISVLLAVIGGAAYTAQKLADPAVVVKTVGAEIIKDVLTSVVVGVVVFCLGSYLEWPSVVQAGLITLGGYGGSRVLEPGLATFIRWISRLGGPAPEAPVPAIPAPVAPDPAPPIEEPK
jgi:hypothetical protein